ncbi:MAG: pro-sigmaK processing inhibitor BofA family protein [Bacillota bacterium]|nr:pro-sigmaK processing inhibitor BofA family protein [Bacillota bacterium]
MFYALAGLALILLSLLLFHPFWRFLPLLILRTALGALALWVLHWPMGYLGGTLGLNLGTALVAGVLEVPGVLLLVALAFWS